MKYEDIFKIYPHKEDKPLEQAKLSATARREQIAARFKQGGDKYESIKADEAWEKSHQETNALLQGDMDTEADEPHHYLGIVDISEDEE